MTDAASDRTLTRDAVLRILEDHREELEQFSVKSLAIFGSTVRNEARPESDVDALVEFRDSVFSGSVFLCFCVIQGT